MRTDQQFDEAHIPGAVCNPMLRAGFGSKLAWLADREQEIVFIGRDDDDGRRAAALAVAVGMRKLGGFLHGGMTSWRQEGRPTESIARARDRWPTWPRRPPTVQILDVREQTEWDAGHIPGSRFTPWHDIAELPEGIDPEKPVAVICGSGQRAATGASLVQRYGAKDVVHVVDGGVPKWGRLGNPLEKSSEPAGAAA